MVGILSLSGRGLACADVVNAMIKLGINGDVTQNVSVVDGIEESGCRVAIATVPYKESVRSLWTHISHTSTLTCAHVRIDDVFSGCVLDYLRPSQCSGKIN